MTINIKRLEETEKLKYITDSVFNNDQERIDYYLSRDEHFYKYTIEEVRFTNSALFAIKHFEEKKKEINNISPESLLIFLGALFIFLLIHITCFFIFDNLYFNKEIYIFSLVLIFIFLPIVYYSLFGKKNESLKKINEMRDYIEKDSKLFLEEYKIKKAFFLLQVPNQKLIEMTDKENSVQIIYEYEGFYFDFLDVTDIKKMKGKEIDNYLNSGFMHYNNKKLLSHLTKNNINNEFFYKGKKDGHTLIFNSATLNVLMENLKDSLKKEKQRFILSIIIFLMIFTLSSIIGFVFFIDYFYFATIFTIVIMFCLCSIVPTLLFRTYKIRTKLKREREDLFLIKDNYIKFSYRKKDY